MAQFSLTEAAFEGFRITRERPWAVLGWIVAYFIFTLGIDMLVTLWGVGQDLAAFKALGQAANPDVAQMAQMLGRIAPYALLALSANVLFFAVMVCAVYRAVLRPFERGMDYLKLGTDELRMIALGFILVIMAMAAFFAVLLVVGFTAETLGAFGEAAGGLAGFLIIVACLCAAVWAAVRLSLAAAMTFNERRLIVFGSWAFTRGQFWPLLGAYLLAFAFGLVVWLLLGLILSVTFQAIGGTADMLTNIPLAKSVGVFLTPPMLLFGLFSSATIIALCVIIVSPSAIAYQGLAKSNPNADVFG
jgi:hypothetical protein